MTVKSTGPNEMLLNWVLASLGSHYCDHHPSTQAFSLEITHSSSLSQSASLSICLSMPKRLGLPLSGHLLSLLQVKGRLLRFLCHFQTESLSVSTCHNQHSSLIETVCYKPDWKSLPRWTPQCQGLFLLLHSLPSTFSAPGPLRTQSTGSGLKSSSKEIAQLVTSVSELPPFRHHLQTCTSSHPVLQLTGSQSTCPGHTEPLPEAGGASRPMGLGDTTRDERLGATLPTPTPEHSYTRQLCSYTTQLPLF